MAAAQYIRLPKNQCTNTPPAGDGITHVSGRRSLDPLSPPPGIAMHPSSPTAARRMPPARPPARHSLRRRTCPPSPPPPPPPAAPTCAEHETSACGGGATTSVSEITRSAVADARARGLGKGV